MNRTTQLVLSAPSYAGLVLGFFFVGVTVWRKRFVKQSGQNGEMKITVHRAFRCEVIFTLIHSLICFATFIAMSRDQTYVPFFVVRAIISSLLVYCSVRDMIDRRELEKYYGVEK